MASSVGRRAAPQAVSGATSPAFLADIPDTLRSELVASLNEVVRNFREGRWEPSELNGGKLCEVVYTILRGVVDGTFPEKASKPDNMVDACLALGRADKDAFPHSVRIAIPRVLTALYDVRNNRNVGHVGGDVDPNHMDASLVLAMSKWVAAELVRLFHGVTTAQAAAYVDTLVDREVPIVWPVAGTKRVLDRSMTQKEKVLVLLYSESGPVPLAKLAEWTKVAARYLKRDVIRPAEDENLLLLEEATGLVHLSPVGSRVVEMKLAKSLLPAA